MSPRTLIFQANKQPKYNIYNIENRNTQATAFTLL